MIYTCTTNPSLDYYISIDNVELGKDNRSFSENYDAGGKGVNVSIVLNNFQIPSICLGFLGGFTKDYYLSFLSDYSNIQPLFTSIKDNTRINLKIMDNSCKTDINAKGPVISDAEFEKFRSRLANIYSDDIFVLSGNIEQEIQDRMIQIVHELTSEGVRVFLDSDASILERCLDIELFAVKLNDANVDESTDIIEYGRSLIEKGIRYVMYSAPGKSSYLFSKDNILTCENHAGSLVNVTGSSDSMVAGFIYGIIRAADDIEAFKYANAASLATAMSNDLSSKDLIEKVFETVEVSRI